MVARHGFGVYLDRSKVWETLGRKEEAAAAKEKLEVRPQTGEAIAGIIRGLLDAPPDVRERMKTALTSRDLHRLEQTGAKK